MLFTLREEHHAVEGDAPVADIVVDLACPAQSKLPVALLAAAQIGEAFDLDIGVPVLGFQPLKSRVQRDEIIAALFRIIQALLCESSFSDFTP